MKKIVQFLFLMTLMWCVGLTASAQRALDVLANPSFELTAAETPRTEEYKVSNAAPTIYGWTLATVGTQFNNTEILDGTSSNSSSQFGTSAPSDGEYSLFFRQGWNGNGNVFTLTSDAIATELAAGSYTIAVDYKQQYSYDNDDQQNSNTKVSIALVAGDETIATATSGAAAGVKGGGSTTYFNTADWSTLSKEFTLEEPVAAGAKIVITLNAAGECRSDFFIDNVVITYKMNSQQLDEAYATWQAANLTITGWDNEFDPKGQVATTTEAEDGVMDLMNEADKKLAAAQAQYAAGDDDIETLINEAYELIEEALALAQENYATAKSLPAGEYILKTTVGEKTYYLAPANAWGTRASLMPNSVAWQLAKVQNGVYTLESVVSNGSGRIYLTPDLNDGQIWSDGAGANIYFTENEDGTYALSANADANYFVAGAAGYMAGSYVVICNGAAADALKWTIVSTSAEFAKGDNVTFLIKCADFGRNNRYRDAWTIETGNGNKNLDGGKNENRCAESYGTTFTLSQTIEGVPNGNYIMTAQGFYRHDWGETIVPPYFYINEVQKAFPVVDGTAGSMNAASADFAAGRYVVELAVKVTDGKITVGAVSTQDGNWNIWDTFTLTYYADDDTEYNRVTNEAPYAELMAALEALVARQAEASASVANYEYVKADVEAVDAKIGTPGDATAEPAVAATGLYKEIADAYAAIKCAEQKDAILTKIGTPGDATAEPAVAATGIYKDIEDYLAKVDNNAAANDDLNAAHEALVAQWQDAYDKINTQYKEYIDDNNEKYIGYLRSLNSIQVEVDALKETIDGYYAAGTSASKKEEVLATIQDLSDRIAEILTTALNTYDSEVADANQKAYNELMAAADEMIERYKEAIKTINEHYAQYHPEAAQKAQVDLFELYEQVRQVKADATEVYTTMEASNAEKFANEDFPLELFDDPDTNDDAYDNGFAALEEINIDNIDRILDIVELDAQEDVHAVVAAYFELDEEYRNKVENLRQIIENLGVAEEYTEMFEAIEAGVAEVGEDIESYGPDANPHKYPVYDENEVVEEGQEPTVIGYDYNCIVEGSAAINEKIEAVQALIDALEAAVAEDQSADWLAQIQEAAEAADELIDEKIEDLATYAEDIQTEYAGKYEKVAEELAAIVLEAIAADEAGELDRAKFDELMAEIGDVDDVPVLGSVDDGPLDGSLFHTWNSTAADAIVTAPVAAGFTSAIGKDAEGNQQGAENGAVVYGVSYGNVYYLDYANLAAYKTMTVTFAEGSGTPRFLFNRMTDNGATIEINGGMSEYKTVAEDGSWVIDIAKMVEDTEFCHLNVVKAGWGQNVQIASIELESAGLTNNTIYQKIYAISVPVENENAYDVDMADLAEYKARLEELNATIEEFDFDEDELTEDPAVIAGAIATLEATVNQYYEEGTLAKRDAEVQQFAEEMIVEPLDDDFDDIFRADLIDRLADVKTKWNTTYADLPEDALFPGSDITNSEVWDMIVDLENDILAEEYAYREDYEEAVEKIETFLIIFEDYDEWIVASTLKGDLNLDGKYTIADIILAAQNALNADEDGKLDGLKKRQAYAADANGDEVYDISDVNAVVDSFLNADDDEEELVAAPARAEIAANDYIVVDGKDVALENTTVFYGFQLDVVAEGNVTVQLSDRAAGYTVMKQKKEGYTRIIGFSMSKTAIDDNSGIILSADSDVTVKTAKFSDAANQTHILSVLTADEATAIAGIEAGQTVDGDIYTVGGAKVNTLQKGVNIIKTANGVKKVLVK